MIAAHEFVSPEPVTVSPVWLPVAREYHVFPENAEVAKSWLCFFVKAGPVYVPPTVPSGVPRWQYSRMMMSPDSVAGRVMLNDVVVVVPPSALLMKVTAIYATSLVRAVQRYSRFSYRLIQLQLAQSSWYLSGVAKTDLR